MTKTVPISIRLPETLVASIRGNAELAGMPLSTFIHHWLEASEEPMRWLALKISAAKSSTADTVAALNRLADKLEGAGAFDMLVEEGAMTPEAAAKARSDIADLKRSEMSVVPLRPTPLEAAIDRNNPRK